MRNRKKQLLLLLVFVALIGHDHESALPARERVEGDRADQFGPRTVESGGRRARRSIEGDASPGDEGGAQIGKLVQDASRPGRPGFGIVRFGLMRRAVLSRPGIR